MKIPNTRQRYPDFAGVDWRPRDGTDKISDDDESIAPMEPASPMDPMRFLQKVTFPQIPTEDMPSIQKRRRVENKQTKVRNVQPTPRPVLQQAHPQCSSQQQHVSLCTNLRELLFSNVLPQTFMLLNSTVLIQPKVGN